MDKTNVLFLGTMALAAVFFLALSSAAQGEGCTDSNNGNFYVKGIAKWDGHSEYDKCLDTQGDTPHVRLIEWYCDGGVGRQFRYTCANGCGDGVCNGPVPGPDSGMPVSVYDLLPTAGAVSVPAGENSVPSQQTAFPYTGTKPAIAMASNPSGCDDSDGGINYYVKGTASGLNQYVTDRCLGPYQLQEAYCDSGFSENDVFFDCPFGCYNGACVPASWTGPLAPSNAVNMSAYELTERRENLEAAHEESGETLSQEEGESSDATSFSPVTTTTLQPYSACVDSDGGRNYNLKGVTNGGNGRFEDKCLNTMDLREWYCDGGLAKTAVHRCRTGCFEGRCR